MTQAPLTNPIRHELLPSQIAAILHVLDHYRRQDQIGYELLQGFAFKGGDDPNSPAGICMENISKITGIRL